jgi:ribosome-associated translation inhibitor RaiA
MQTPLQLTFRSMGHSDALAAHVQRSAEHLERLSDRIVSCRVVVELVGHHHRHGDRYRVTLNVGVPGHELIVNREPSEDRNAESAQVTTQRAFDEAARQLEDWVQRRRSGRHEQGRSSA